MSIFQRDPYTSEATQFIEQLKAQKPLLEGQQRDGRALLWDKAVDREAQAEFGAARVAQMQARVAHYELDADASKSLVAKAHQSQNQANKLLADLKQAQADAIAAQMDLGYTRIRAPFDGVFVKGAIDEGSFANVGNPLGRLVNLNPLRIVVYVGEQEYPLLTVGQECNVLLPQGETRLAKITFKSPVTTNKTHTFEVHLELDNPNYTLPEGLAVTTLAQTNHALATTLPASLLTLDDEGKMGVKTIDSESKVRFIPLTLLSGNHEHVIVSGLTEPVRIITRGQEFVNEGQAVSFEDEAPLHPESAPKPQPPVVSEAP